MRASAGNEAAGGPDGLPASFWRHLPSGSRFAYDPNFSPLATAGFFSNHDLHVLSKCGQEAHEAFRITFGKREE